ncbi:MAG: hypothetical protein F6J92_16705 [Symploca sp. SIO1A3]|nr:hypothetical protein [Symploca sp. SIO1A3]
MWIGGQQGEFVSPMIKEQQDCPPYHAIALKMIETVKWYNEQIKKQIKSKG